MKSKKQLIALVFAVVASAVFNGCAAMMAGLAGGAMRLDSGPDDLNLTGSNAPIPYQAEASNGAMQPANGGKLYGHY